MINTVAYCCHTNINLVHGQINSLSTMAERTRDGHGLTSWIFPQIVLIVMIIGRNWYGLMWCDHQWTASQVREAWILEISGRPAGFLPDQMTPQGKAMLLIGSYFMVAIVIFSNLEGWHPLDVIYFSIITLMTATWLKDKGGTVERLNHGRFFLLFFLGWLGMVSDIKLISRSFRPYP